MKLRNKKTGEIRELPDGFFCGDNLKKICEEWEDYEETKEYYYYIDDLGIVSIDREQSSTITMRKNFGNYFDTREEAEKAVEKFKAWKRLKDKGFRFTTCYMPKSVEELEISASCKGDYLDIMDDLDLLFGGEE